MKTILTTILYATLIWIAIGLLTILAYGMGSDGSDSLSQHYRGVINFIL